MTAEHAELRRLSFEDFPAEYDHLEFTSAAQGLAAALMKSELPLTLAVFGPWGAGKSSFIGLVRRCLDEDPRFLPILFEPWKLEASPSIVYDLVSTIHLAAENSREVRRISCHDEDLARQLFQQLENIHFYDLRRTLLGAVEGVANVQLGFGAGIRSLLERLWPEAPAKIAELRLEAATKLPGTFGKYIRSLGVTPVIFIDDIDRCRPDTVVSLFENLKLYFQPKECPIAFVIAMDHEMVTNAICARYGFTSRIDGRQYLDKICNASYYVPRPELTGLIKSLMATLRLENDRVDTFWECATSEEFLDMLFACNLYLPRRVKKIIRESYAAVAEDFYGLSEQIQALSVEHDCIGARYSDISAMACYKLILGLYILREGLSEIYARLVYRPYRRRADLLLDLAEAAARHNETERRASEISEVLSQFGLADLQRQFSSTEALNIIERAFRRSYIFGGWPAEELLLYEPQLRQRVLNPLLDQLMKK